MARIDSLELECPHCKSQCQFTAVASHILSIFRQKLTKSTLLINIQHILGLCDDMLTGYEDLPALSDKLIHEAFRCTSCKGLIVVEWTVKWDKVYRYLGYFPCAGDFKPKVDLDYIEKEEVRDDFKEAINCYNNKFWKASMIMSRRTIQQELNGTSENSKKPLAEQINLENIPEETKNLFHQVRIFGNYGAHPDFCLYDKEGNLISKDEEQKIAIDALFVLDLYFTCKYEMPKRVANSRYRERGKT